MNVHFIAIGGTAMHNLAIALKRKGYNITGSDDEIFEPSLSRLKKENILPDSVGWDIEKIHNKLDAVILGMHARIDNPELIKAQELGIPVFSYPEYLFEQSKYKTRIVIGGSHGKTTITSMVIHALLKNGIDCDYMVGASADGIEDTVKLSKDAPFMIIEGDEYLTSPIDLRPKFHLYRPHIALISGIAWDHINVFPTYMNYVDQFRIFATLIEKNGFLVYFEGDEEVVRLAEKINPLVNKISYGIPAHRYSNGRMEVLLNENVYSLEIFGEHNLANLNGAKEVCRLAGLPEGLFLKAMETYKGASNRLQVLAESTTKVVYKDFAHSPSKVLATVNAVRQKFPERKLVGCMELHTFSSLNKKFLSNYRGTFEGIDFPIVYYNPHSIEMKKLPTISSEEVYEAFGHPNLLVFSSSDQLIAHLHSLNLQKGVLLLMSSGNFNGADLTLLAEKFIRSAP